MIIGTKITEKRLSRQFVSRGLLSLVLFAASTAAHAAPAKYIVRFKSPQAYSLAKAQMHAATFSGHLGQASNSVVAPEPAKLLNTSAVVSETLNNVKMMVVDAADAQSLAELRARPEIESVEAEFFHPAPQLMSTRSLMRNQPMAPASLVMDRPWGIDAVRAPQAWASTRGQGARVMVLDTGLDTEHEAVRANFEKSKNFTSVNPDDVTDEVGHGTHVSGTILADGQGGHLVGVAPEAKLLMGKVCSVNGCSNIAIVRGIDWAVSEKVDVVNMSLGGIFMSDAEAQAVIRAEQAGVVIAAASGNDGRGRVSYPAAADTVFAVGAVDETLAKAEFSNWGPQLDIVAPGVEVLSSVPRGTGRGSSVQMDVDGSGLVDVRSTPFVGSPTQTVSSSDIVFVGLGKPADYQGVDLRGKVALISRGEIAFKDKVAGAINAGAVAAVIFNNAPGLIQGAITDDGSEVAIPAVMIEQSLGEQLKSVIASKGSVRMNIGVIRTDYAAFQGTSMATPHVAGVIALVRAANKSLTPAQVRELIKATATPLSPNDQNQFGAGMINAEAAVSRALGFAPVLSQLAN